MTSHRRNMLIFGWIAAPLSLGLWLWLLISGLIQEDYEARQDAALLMFFPITPFLGCFFFWGLGALLDPDQK